MKQRGFINLDSYFTGIFVGIATVGAVFGFVLAFVLVYVVPWLWSFIKPWIHALTA